MSVEDEGGLDRGVMERHDDNGLRDERTPLLAKKHNAPHQSEVSQIVQEFWSVFKSSVPVILAYILQNSLQTISVVIVGRLSPEALSVAAFSYMFAMSTGWLIGMGGSTAIDTLASASFTGSQNKHDLGVILQRALLVLTLFYIPLAALWICSETIFRVLGQEEYIIRDASRFLTALIPGGLGFVYFECMKKYLQAQEIMRPGTYVLLITSPVNAGLNYLFVHSLGMGLLGAPLATGMSYWLSFFLLLLYARFVAGWECWGGFNRQAFHHLGSFARIAAMGIIQVGTEWWAFEIVAIVAGQLGPLQLAVQSVIMTADQVLNTIPFGIGIATSGRVGNLLGAKDARGAARAANIAAVFSMFMGAIVLAILMSTRHNFARLFNDDKEVVKLTATILPYVALFQIADGLSASCGGSLRGMGRQHIGALVNLGAYYCAALPLGIYLAFHGWKLAGLWVGQCCALYVVGFSQWAIVAFSSWDREVERAFARIRGEENLTEQFHEDAVASEEEFIFHTG